MHPQTTEPTSGTAPQPTQLTRVLADQLDYIADQLRAASLRLPGPVALTVNLFAIGGRDEVSLATVDALAQITGQSARWDNGGGKYGNYRTELRHGQAWTLICHAFEKRPASTEDQLRARVAELEAQLAAGGAR